MSVGAPRRGGQPLLTWSSGTPSGATGAGNRGLRGARRREPRSTPVFAGPVRSPSPTAAPAAPGCRVGCARRRVQVHGRCTHGPGGSVRRGQRLLVGAGVFVRGTLTFAWDVRRRRDRNWRAHNLTVVQCRSGTVTASGVQEEVRSVPDGPNTGPVSDRRKGRGGRVLDPWRRRPPVQDVQLPAEGRRNGHRAPTN